MFSLTLTQLKHYSCNSIDFRAVKIIKYTFLLIYAPLVRTRSQISGRVSISSCIRSSTDHEPDGVSERWHKH